MSTAPVRVSLNTVGKVARVARSKLMVAQFTGLVSRDLHDIAVSQLSDAKWCAAANQLELLHPTIMTFVCNPFVSDAGQRLT